MRLSDGRTLCLEVPGRWVTKDRDGSTAFLPEGVAFLDRVRALFMSALDRAPSPGYIVRLREGLGLTQREFAERVNVDKMTVSRWERGTVRPSAEALKAIEKLRKEALRRGVTIES
jgi:DNA-binding XRE family transcriptional regulator